MQETKSECLSLAGGNKRKFIKTSDSTISKCTNLSEACFYQQVINEKESPVVYHNIWALVPKCYSISLLAESEKTEKFKAKV